MDLGGDENNDEEQFVLDDYESDGENASKGTLAGGVYSAATLALMDQLGIGQILKEEAVEDEDETKVSH